MEAEVEANHHAAASPQQEGGDGESSEYMPPMNELLSRISVSLPTLLTDSPLPSWLVSLASILLTLLLVVVFVAFGWWIVWICFLSRFKFVRELLGGGNNPAAQQTGQTSSSSSSSAPERKSRKPRRRIE